MASLKKSLTRFGDLGGIVFNRASGNLVGGHQRVAAFRSDPEAKIVITEQLDPPDSCGTVAVGFVVVLGTRHGYRVVEWDSLTESAANIAANQHGGEFDDEMLA